MRKLLLLGGTGLLGQAVKETALDRGISVQTVARSNADVNMDATESQSLERLLDDYCPDLIVNCMAWVNLAGCEENPGSAYLVNAKPVLDLVKYSKISGTKLLQVSTDHYYIGAGDTRHDEHNPVTLLNQYAATKYAGEMFALSDQNALVLRTNIVGFRGWADRPTFVEWAVDSLSRKQPMTLFDDFYTSSIDVHSAASTMLDLAHSGACGIYNVAASSATSKLEFINGLAKEFGFETTNCRSGSMHETVSPVMRADSLGLNVKKGENHLGYKFPSPSQVLKNLADQYQKS